MLELKDDLIIPTDNSSSVSVSCHSHLYAPCYPPCSTIKSYTRLYDNAFITVYIELFYQQKR